MKNFFDKTGAPTIIGLAFLCCSHSICVIAEELALPPPPRQLNATIGFEYSADTSVPGQESNQKTLPFGFALETEKYIFEVTIPYIQRTAPSGKVAKSHHHESRKESNAVAPIVTDSGLGDITSSIEYKVLDEPDSSFTVSAKGEVKWAVADVASGLGTGVNDYAAELNASKSLGDFSASASFGYAILGSPGEVEINDVKKSLYFNNIFYGTAGISYPFTENLNSALQLEAGQATETGGSPQRDLSISMEYQFSAHRKLQFQLVKSLSPGINSWGTGASFSAPF